MTSAAVPFQLGYRRSLDGLRGVAILLVVANHGGLLRDGYGFIGVNTFFVLSGFLITSLLILEQEAHGSVKLSFFYLRRALRLLPALLAMLAAFLIYALATMSGRELVNTLHEEFWALFYFTNWAKILQLGPSLQMAHTWSLSLEEQFYFCWPWLLLFLLRRNSRPSLLCWVILGVTRSEAIRVFLFTGNFRLAYDQLDRLITGLDTRADSLLLGAAVAVAATSNLLPLGSISRRLIALFSVLSVLGLAGLGLFRMLSPGMVYAGWLAASVCAAVLIVQLIVNTAGPINRLLEMTTLVYVGRISYSLYVWHFPIAKILDRYKLAPPDHYWPYWTAIFPAALASYYLIERPCLRLKRRFQRTEPARPI